MQLRQSFTDPQTGQYNPQVAYQSIMEFKKRTPQLYQYFIESLRENRQREKYTSLILNTTYVPKWIAERQSADNSLMASISYVKIPYSSISDSTIKVSDQDIIDYIKKRPDEYKQEKSRSITYVAFSAAPSAADSASTRDKLKNLSTEFATTNDVKAFLLKTSSEIPYYDGYIAKSRIQVPFKDSILKTAVGGVYGPYLDQRNYVLAKIVAEKQMPDTVKVRHILVATQQRDPQSQQSYRIREDSTAKRIIDSIQLAIRNGANFDTLVNRYSDDPGSKTKGGVYDSIPSGQMVTEFNDFIFTNPVGTKGVVKTDYGYHYVEILAQKGSEPGYKIAYLALPIFTSQETENAASGAASQFAAQSRNAKQFDENANKQNLQKLVVQDVHPGDYIVGDLGSSRDLVRWMYQADIGDVVDQPYSIGDKYIVASVTEINDEGLMPAQKARPTVEGLVRNHLKAQQIIKQIGKVTTLEAAASLKNAQLARADSVSFASPFIQNVGQELKVIGAAFYKQGAGKVLGPIEGSTGVFVVKPETIYAKPSPGGVEGVRANLEMQVKSFAERSLEGIKKAATIKDNREKF